MKPTVVAGARDTRRFAAGEDSGGHAQGVLDYARIDLVPGPGGAPLVMELEVAEPSLVLATSPGAAERFAQAVASTAGARRSR